jgi:RNA polymerase-binding transcription factor DksA
MPINEILIKLKEKKAQLIKRIEAIEGDFKKGRSADFAEQTTECENDEVLDEIHHEAKTELHQIKAALLRIQNDDYGVCINCAEKIAVERLKALPYANTCIDCAL